MSRMSDDELFKLITTIDQQLQARGVPIHLRAIEVVGEFQRRTGIHEIWFRGSTLGAEQPTHPERIFAWYDAHYGDRQKVDMSPGATLLVIRGEPWKCVFPRIFGRVQLDLGHHIADFPEELARSLEPGEIQLLIATFAKRLDLAHRLEMSRLKYIDGVMKDIVHGVNEVCKAPPDFPIAKLSFSHAAEKCLKGCIAWKGGAVQKNHRLIVQAREAKKLGLPEVPKALLDALYCPGGARYGEYPVNCAESVAAHEACWEVVGILLAAIDRRPT